MTPNEKPASPTQGELAVKALLSLADDMSTSRIGDEFYKRVSINRSGIEKAVAEIRRIAAFLDRTTLSPTEEGMVLVPKEPTEAMLRAAIDAIPMDKYIDVGSRRSKVTLSTDECATIYHTMVAAGRLALSSGREKE